MDAQNLMLPTLCDLQQLSYTVIDCFRSLAKQESRAVARKPCDAAAVLFGLKFADNIQYKFKSSQASKVQASELQTYQRKTEFNIKWPFKVIQSHVFRSHWK